MTSRLRPNSAATIPGRPRRVSRFWAAAIGLLAAHALAACSYSVEKNRVRAAEVSSRYKAGDLTFVSVYNRVFRPNCVGCHGNEGGVNLQSYERTKAAIDKIYQDVFVTRSMPKKPLGSALSDDQLELLQAWIRAGFPESAPPGSSGEGGAAGGGDVDVGGPAPVPLAPTFASIRYNVLEPRCVSCHAPGKSVARIPLVTKEDLLDSPLDIVVPGSPDDSGLMITIRGVNPRKIMPPLSDPDGKPTGFSRLSGEEIEVVGRWIQNGAMD